MDRFWSKVDRPSPYSCWEWTAYLNPRTGYGQFTIGGTVDVAHRVAWELTHGPVPEGKELDHLCRNRACANPLHLEPVTHAVNAQRGRTGKWERPDHCPQGHPFDETNTYIPPPTSPAQRQCRICRNEAAARYRARRKVKVT